jgi:hypothetical protein
MKPSVNTKDELKTTENLAEQLDTRNVTEAGRRGFVEPEISVPVDVLEATTFFQGVTSGVTLP